ncbi:hypothetical protein CPB85DRAFT_1324310 [Mucidula mucida]|nr:hypothetical protein CPB85DRAFT_1324310 [Mucidula mucida]
MQVPLNLHHSEPHLVLSVLSQTTALATLQLEANIFDFRLDRIDEWSKTQVTDVMKALEVVAGQRVVFLPRLVSIDIEVTGHTDLYFIPYLRPPDDFVGMLKARHEVGLRRFHFGVRADHGSTSDNGPESVFDDHENCVLRGLVEDGMSLEIRFNGVLASGL